MLRVGVAGLIHGHVWGLIDGWSAVEGAKLVAVADATPLLEKAKDRFERTYTSSFEMLEKEELDVLVVTDDNVQSSKIAIAALKKGIPCLVEKPMASTAADAEAMIAASKESGALLMINWPFAWWPTLHELKKQVDAGAIGKPFHLHFRFGHRGPKEIGCDEYFVGWLYDEARNGGGAIADFGGYGAVLCSWYFGLPETVYAVRGNYTKDYEVSDDHAVIVMKYPKMDVVIEPTWATLGFPSGPNPVIFGKDGALGVLGQELEHVVGREITKLTPEPLPITNACVYFAELLENKGKPFGVLDPEVAANACRIMDAALKSTRTGAAEKVV